MNPTFKGGDLWLSWNLRRAVPWQRGLEVFYARGLWQPFKCVAQPRIGLLAVGFSRLDQTVKLSAGHCAFGRVAEQPVLAPDNEGPDRTF